MNVCVCGVYERVCMNVCICVCVCEIEREREKREMVKYNCELCVVIRTIVMVKGQENVISLQTATSSRNAPKVLSSLCLEFSV